MSEQKRFQDFGVVRTIIPKAFPVTRTKKGSSDGKSRKISHKDIAQGNRNK